jgi:hypothetical protein
MITIITMVAMMRQAHIININQCHRPRRLLTIIAKRIRITTTTTITTMQTRRRLRTTWIIIIRRRRRAIEIITIVVHMRPRRPKAMWHHMTLRTTITMIAIIKNSRPPIIRHIIIVAPTHERVESADRRVRAQEAIRDHVHQAMVVVRHRHIVVHKSLPRRRPSGVRIRVRTVVLVHHPTPTRNIKSPHTHCPILHRDEVHRRPLACQV